MCRTCSRAVARYSCGSYCAIEQPMPQATQIAGSTAPFNRCGGDPAQYLIINPRKRQHALQDRAKADQNNEQFKKICEPAIGRELVDGPKAYRPDNNDDEHAD